MIPNFSTGGDPGGLARYLLGYKSKTVDKQATVLGSAGVRTDTLAHLTTDFELGAMLHPELGRSVLHISLSFNPDDAARMTDQKMRQIAEEYLEEMGMKGTQYLLVRHRDRPHQHLHIMANRVADDGHTIPDGNNFLASKNAVKELVARHELSPAKERRPHLQHPERLRGRDLNRFKLRAAVDEELAPDKHTHRPVLLAALEAKGIACREYRDKNGNVTGISFRMDGFACKGSALGPEYSSVGIDRRLAANQQKATEAAGQRTESTTLPGPAAAAVGADAARAPAVLPASPPAVEPARAEAAVGFSALLQAAVKEVLDNRPVGPIREELPSSVAPVPAASKPDATETPGETSGPREAVQALPLVPAGPAKATVEASTGARESEPVVVPISPKEAAPVEEVKQSPLTGPATSEPIPAPAEAQEWPPTAAAESTSPATPVALVPAAALPQGQVSTAVNVSQASEPARVNESVPLPAATAPPTEAAVPPAPHFTSATDFDEKTARWEAQKPADVDDKRLAGLYSVAPALAVQPVAPPVPVAAEAEPAVSPPVLPPARPAEEKPSEVFAPVEVRVTVPAEAVVSAVRVQESEQSAPVQVGSASSVLPDFSSAGDASAGGARSAVLVMPGEQPADQGAKANGPNAVVPAKTDDVPPVETATAASAAVTEGTEAEFVPRYLTNAEAKEWDRKFAAWEEKKAAEARYEEYAVRYNDLLQETTRKIALADETSYQSRPAFEVLLQAHGLTLLPAAGEEPVRVVHLSSGEDFPAADILLAGRPFLDTVQAKVASAEAAAVPAAIDWEPRYQQYIQERAAVLAHNSALIQVNWLLEDNPHAAGVAAAIVLVQAPGSPLLSNQSLLQNLQTELTRQQAREDEIRWDARQQARLQEVAKGKFGFAHTPAAINARSQLKYWDAPTPLPLNVGERRFLQPEPPALTLKQFAQQHQPGFEAVQATVKAAFAAGFTDWHAFKARVERSGIEATQPSAGIVVFRHKASGQAYRPDEIVTNFREQYDEAKARGQALEAKQPKRSAPALDNDREYGG